MSKVTGVVDRVLSFNGPKGTTYSLKLTDGELYGFYTNKPNASQGDTVEFDFKANGNFKNADARSLKVVAAAGTANVAGSSSATVSSGSASSGSTWGKNTEQQIIISKQAARNTAVEWIAFLAHQEAIPFPANAKTAKGKYQFLEVFLEQITSNFFDYSQGKDGGTKSASGGQSKASDGLDDLEDEAEWAS